MEFGEDCGMGMREGLSEGSGGVFSLLLEVLGRIAPCFDILLGDDKFSSVDDAELIGSVGYKSAVLATGCCSVDVALGASATEDSTTWLSHVLIAFPFVWRMVGRGITKGTP